MVVILCLDDHHGMMFNKRRQSKDLNLLKNVIKLCKEHTLYLKEYTNEMFNQYGFKEPVAAPDFIQIAGINDYCFIEDINIQPYLNDIEKIVLYKWNRHYPADLFFDISLLDKWSLKESIDFQGVSHDKITREIYKR